MFGNYDLCGLLEEDTHEKSPKYLSGNLGDFGKFCKGLQMSLLHGDPILLTEKGRLKRFFGFSDDLFNRTKCKLSVEQMYMYSSYIHFIHELKIHTRHIFLESDPQ